MLTNCFCVQNRYSIKLHDPNLGPRERLAVIACVLNVEFDFFSYILDYIPLAPLALWSSSRSFLSQYLDQ